MQFLNKIRELYFNPIDNRYIIFEEEEDYDKYFNRLFKNIQNSILQLIISRSTNNNVAEIDINFLLDYPILESFAPDLNYELIISDILNKLKESEIIEISNKKIIDYKSAIIVKYLQINISDNDIFTFEISFIM